MKPSRLAPLILVATAFLCGCATQPMPRELAEWPSPHLELPPGAAMVDGRARFRDIFCSVLARRNAIDGGAQGCAALLWQLADEPATDSRPLPEPDLVRQVYVLPGAFSECLGEEAMPFRSAAQALTTAGYRISTIMVSGRSGSEHNAAQIAERLTHPAPGEEGPVILIGYSKGAIDILEFLVRYPAAAARVESVVTVAGAIGGSPLADHVEPVYSGLFGRIPYRRCEPGDGQVLASLLPQARREWLADNALPDTVQYFSLGGFTTRGRLSVGLVPAWKRLLRYSPHNDGQLLTRDMLIPGGTLLGYQNADHWSAAIDVETVHPVLGPAAQVPQYPRTALLEAILLQVAESRRVACRADRQHCAIQVEDRSPRSPRLPFQRD